MLRPVPQRLTTTSSSAETTPDGVVSLEEKRGAQVLVINWFSFLPIENFHSEIDWFLLKGSVNLFFFFCKQFSFVRKLCASEEMESEPEHTHTDIDQTEEHCARQLLCLTEQRTREEPEYIHIDQNEFSHRR